MRICARIAVVAALLMVFAPGAQAQKVIRITLDEKPQTDPLTPGDLTRQKLERCGMVDGQDWSISIDLLDTRLDKALDYIVELAAAKPRQIKAVYNRREIEDMGLDLEGTVTVKANNLSLAEALRMVLRADIGYEVQDDGTLVIAPLDVLNEHLPVRIYDVGNVLASLRSPEAGHNTTTDLSTGVVDRLDMSAQEQLQCLIERNVRTTEPWESMGGRATIDFGGSGLMIVSNTSDGHRKVIDLCKGLLVAERQRRDDLKQRLQEVEASVADLRRQRQSLSADIRATTFQGDAASLGGVPIYGTQGILDDIQERQRVIRSCRAEMIARKAELEAQRLSLAETRDQFEREAAADPLYGARKRRAEQCRADLQALLDSGEDPNAPEVTKAMRDLEIAESQLASPTSRTTISQKRLQMTEDAISQTWHRAVQAEGQLKAAEAELKAMNPEQLLELADKIEDLRRQRDVVDGRIAERQALADTIRRRLDGVPEPRPNVAAGAAAPAGQPDGASE